MPLNQPPQDDFDITALFPSARRLRALVRGVPGVNVGCGQRLTAAAV